MHNTLIKNILSFIVLLLAQVFVFDNIRLGSYVHPCVYVLFILVLPFDTPNWRLLIDGFLLGFVIDIFEGTPGLNAAATVLMAYVRPFIISTMTRKSDLQEKVEPTIARMGFTWFLVYSLILLTIHNFALFTLEAFSIKLLGIVLLEVLLSVPASLFVIFLILYLLKPLKKN